MDNLETLLISSLKYFGPMTAQEIRMKFLLLDMDVSESQVKEAAKKLESKGMIKKASGLEGWRV